MIYSPKILKSDFSNWLQQKLLKLNRVVPLNIVQIGDLLASTTYVGMKQKIGEKLGFEVNTFNFRVDAGIDELKSLIELFEKNNAGTIIQLPVPEKFQTLVDKLSSQIDVDMLGENTATLWQKGVLPPTVQAIDLVLKDILQPNTNFEHKINQSLNLAGKTVGIIGQGVLVGKPLLKYLSDRQATIISINKDTQDPKSLSRLCDILITAAGSPELITQSWVKNKTIIIDAATSESNGHLVGDLNQEEFFEDCVLCPSPGGIGGVTVLCLFYNTLKLNLANA